MIRVLGIDETWRHEALPSTTAAFFSPAIVTAPRAASTGRPPAFASAIAVSWLFCTLLIFPSVAGIAYEATTAVRLLRRIMPVLPIQQLSLTTPIP